MPIKIGAIKRMTKVSLQLSARPTISPAAKVDTYCVTMENLLPNPSLIRSMSLRPKSNKNKLASRGNSDRCRVCILGQFVSQIA